jgi:SAM-dependent methyltransferase
VPDETYWFERHVVAYEVAATHVDGARVLDAGCGEGYGLAMLEQAGAARVVGADLDAQAAEHAARTYGTDRVEVVACELMDLPLDDDSIDVSVSFQVIEHVHDVPGYLASLRRVTRPGGRVLLATPNRLTFTPDSDVPVNPFHVREFTATELAAEVTAAGLVVDDVLGVHHGARIREWEAASGAPFMERMTTEAPEAWPQDYRERVHAVTVGDFDLRSDDLDRSLDLLALCHVP